MRRFVLCFICTLASCLVLAQGYNSKGGSHRGYQTPYTQQEQQPSTWSGSGIALSSKVFATNNHVVEGATHLYVYFPATQTRYQAQTIDVDAANDLAIVRITDPSFKGFPAIKYGFKKALEDVGTEVFVLGYPRPGTMGEEVKLTTGVVSSRSGFEGNQSQYQVSAPVQPGNSGGPLFNDEGELIGIVSSKHTDGAENVSYAVKLSYLGDLVAKSGENINLNRSSQIAGQKLKDQCKEVIPCTVMVIADNERDGRTANSPAVGSTYRSASQTVQPVKFMIRNAYIDGKDLSEHYRSVGACLSLYDDNGVPGMSIVMPKAKSQSYGHITDLDIQTYPETPYSYERSVLKYTWHYQNSYDNKKGAATCRLDVTVKENEILFVLEYVLSDGSMARFSGTM